MRSFKTSFIVANNYVLKGISKSVIFFEIHIFLNLTKILPELPPSSWKQQFLLYISSDGAHHAYVSSNFIRDNTEHKPEQLCLWWHQPDFYPPELALKEKTFNWAVQEWLSTELSVYSESKSSWILNQYRWIQHILDMFHQGRSRFFINS